MKVMHSDPRLAQAFSLLREVLDGGAENGAAESRAWSGREGAALASTSEVYGKGARVPFSEEDDLLLGPSSKSRWGYAATSWWTSSWRSPIAASTACRC
jgi:hypothetical protein